MQVVETYIFLSEMSVVLFNGKYFWISQAAFHWHLTPLINLWAVPRVEEHKSLENYHCFKNTDYIKQPQTFSRFYA